MPNGTTSPTPQPQAAGDAQAKQMQDIMLRLMQQVSKPIKTVQPPAGSPSPSTHPTSQQFVHGLFGIIQQAVQADKQQQLLHATGVLQNLNNALVRSYEFAQGDEQKAIEHFSHLPEVMQVFMDKKNRKQLGKLLQMDFLEPEKKKTVWHEALAKVASAAEKLPMVKAISAAMQKHKESGQQQYDPAAKEQQASTMASRFAGLAQPDPIQQAEISKMLPSMVVATGADIREREKEVHAIHLQEMKQDFTKSIDFIKDPVSKAVARGIQLQQEGNLTEAQKWFDTAHKGAEAKSARGEQMTLPALIYKSINDPDPEKRLAAQKAIDKTWAEQEKQLLMRGQAFGMSRIAQYVNEDTGETQPFNGFQVQNRIKAGESWQMVGNIPPDTVLAMQQVARTYQPSLTAVEGHLKAFDNSSDRAIIARIKTANPNIRGMDESTLGTWIDQNLTDKLSDDGKQLVQDIRVLAEVMGRLRKLTGQSSSEMNTSLLLGLLPDERTPNSTYGRQQLEKVRNYIDGMVQAPILGGGRFAGAAPKSSPKKPDDKDDKGRVVSLD